MNKRDSIPINLKVGQKIRLLRKRKKLSQEKFAEICGLHRTYIGSVERGERNITLVSLEKIAKALNVDVSDLLR